ncbi:MAG TPA: c-type cytochrome [Planctomycetota bacterium]|nr:c-type cytochrome [Planctomycetota bacterium]
MFRYSVLLVTILLAAPLFAADETDVTAKVAAAVKNNKLSIAASNETFGDTAPQVPKSLRVEYSVGTETMKREVPENGQMEIAAPAGKTLLIKKAIYGPSDGSAAPARNNAAAFNGDPASLLDTLPGFKVEHILKADRAKNGSWICMAKDPKGRLLLGGQNGQPITRVTIEDGKVAKQEILTIPVSETMGMLFVGNTLYLNGHGKNDKGQRVFGLFRCTDPKGNDSYDSVEYLREWHNGSGEHGAHGIVLGPDKMLYMVCGNFTTLPDGLSPTSPHRNYADDLVLPRTEDGNGFGAGKVPPGGFIARMDLDGKNPELFASGQRNTYDIALNADGELFGFDSDMEWDWGTPWYRPIRVFHAVRGGDTGFREGSAKWPEYYHDSVPCAVTIGIGCPTGVGFGTGAKFPVKYQKAFYILDWTYGRLIAAHLTPNGASYTGTWENFVAPMGLHGGAKTPLNLTDVVIGDDGAMYFTIGGRGTQASLFRVSYIGNELATPVAPEALRDKEGNDARALRHKLEAFNVKPDPAAVEFAWPHLNSPDRFIRYAARLAIERNPIEQWQSKALAEKQPNAAFTALLALARLGTKETQNEIFKSLEAIPFGQLSDDQKLEKLRTIEVSIARQGVPAGDVAKQLIADVDPLFPAKTEFLNRELCQILLALNAPKAVAKTVGLLVSAPTQEEQLTYILHLRSIKSQWTLDLSRKYMQWWNDRSQQHPPFVVKWFEDAGIKFNNGSSFANFISHIHEEAKFSVTSAIKPDEMAALADIFAAYSPAPPKKVKSAAAAARKFVKEWTTADIQPLLDQVGHGRNFARGKAIFEEAQCLACHRYGDQGGAIGPDLTALAARYKRQDMLESITEPSKVLSEQFMNTAIKTTDGKVVVGRIVDETADKIVLRPNPLETATETIKQSDIKARELSKISPMPVGLLNNFTKEEFLDLLAYLESLGDPKHPNFK